MTHEKRESQWSSPERQEDLKYQERMKEYFAPDSARPTNRNGSNGGRLSHPLAEDTTVIDPAESERGQDTPPRGYPRAAERGVQGKTVREPVRDPEGLDLRRILLFALAALAVVVFLVFVWWLLFGRGGGVNVTFVTQKRVAFTTVLAIFPARRMPTAQAKRALRTSVSAYTSSSVRAPAKEEDAWAREQEEETVNHENASKG